MKLPSRLPALQEIELVRQGAAEMPKKSVMKKKVGNEEREATFPLHCEINENIIKTFMGCFRNTEEKIIN
jgi:hypothetical protein